MEGVEGVEGVEGGGWRVRMAPQPHSPFPTVPHRPGRLDAACALAPPGLDAAECARLVLELERETGVRLLVAGCVRGVACGHVYAAVMYMTCTCT